MFQEYLVQMWVGFFHSYFLTCEIGKAELLQVGIVYSFLGIPWKSY